MIKMRIVVGASGSAGSTAAVRWAAGEARLRGAELRVLTAYHRGRQSDEDTAAVVHHAVAQAREVAPDIEVRGVALAGYAAPLLLHAAEEAALLVVGDRGSSGFPGVPFGSVGSQVATQARSCVVVVRGRPDDSGPVVVGVDGGPQAGAVVGRAFEEAALRGTDLLAVTAHAVPRSAGTTAKQALGADMDHHLDPWREKYPEVRAEREFVSGRADKVMELSCRQAQLVVVGPRGHGFEGVMLGSIGSRLLRRADCPVLIARS
jgi:nucleotide-binding universal stress UspA family protein